MTLKTPDLTAYDGAPPLRLAMCQVRTAPWDHEGNLARTLAALDRAAELDADLAVTPECVFHGYGFPEPGEAWPAPELFAVAPDGPELAAVRERVERHAMPVLVGFAERAGDTVHNTAALLRPGVAEPRLYRKVHCRDFEAVDFGGPFTPGDAFWVEPLEIGGRTVRVGVMICFDREIPETVRCLRALGAELILCPLATNTSPLLTPCDQREQIDNETITRARAAENEVFIAVVNHAGRFNGGSFVAGPGGQVVRQLDDAEQVDLIELPVGIIAEKFHAAPLGWMGWGFRRPAIYDKYLREAATPAAPIQS